MHWKSLIILILFTVILSAGFLLFALSIPAHLSGVDKHVLEKAGEDTRDIQQEIKSLIALGYTGPAEILAWWSNDKYALLEIGGIIQKFPECRFSGGNAPYFEQFLSRIKIPSVIEGQSVNTMRVLIPADNRRVLLGYLKKSRVHAVKKLLMARELTNVVAFPPVHTASGGPLEASILATALLVQGGHLSAHFVDELIVLVNAAKQGDQDALGKLERFYMAILGSGYRLNWGQLTAFISRCESPDIFIRFLAQLREHTDGFKTLYAALLLSNNAPQLIKYVESYGSVGGYDSLDTAVAYGKGGLDLLLQRQQMVFKPRKLLEPLHRYSIPPILVLKLPGWALGVKFVALFLAIFCLSVKEKSLAEAILG